MPKFNVAIDYKSCTFHSKTMSTFVDAEDEREAMKKAEELLPQDVRMTIPLNVKGYPKVEEISEEPLVLEYKEDERY